MPIHAVQFAKDMEKFKLFFLEDVLAPEDIEGSVKSDHNVQLHWLWVNSSTILMNAP